MPFPSVSKNQANKDQTKRPLRAFAFAKALRPIMGASATGKDHAMNIPLLFAGVSLGAFALFQACGGRVATLIERGVLATAFLAIAVAAAVAAAVAMIVASV